MLLPFSIYTNSIYGSTALYSRINLHIQECLSFITHAPAPLPLSPPPSCPPLCHHHPSSHLPEARHRPSPLEPQSHPVAPAAEDVSVHNNRCDKAQTPNPELLEALISRGTTAVWAWGPRCLRQQKTVHLYRCKMKLKEVTANQRVTPM